MIAPTTLAELRGRAMRTRTRIVALVIMANDSIRMVEAGPRGGWRVVNPEEGKT